MNIERLNIIAEWLEAGAPHRGGHGFNMNSWGRRYNHGYTDYAGNRCGTALCIGGAAEQFFTGEIISDNIHDELNVGEDVLGLARHQARDLFYPETLTISNFETWDDITPQHAAMVIRHLIKTGKVDWNLE